MKAFDYFFLATRYELLPELSKRIIPLLEKDEDYQGLSEIHDRLKKTYDKIIDASKKERILGKYYFVSFYGHTFKYDHGCEYIYKEPNVTPLAVIVDRLRTLYTPKCVNLTIIQESGKIKWKDMDQNNDYIQIFHVSPNFIDKKSQQSQYYSHHNIGSFFSETPFTKSGKAHGSITDQWKRITVYKTTQCFPFIKKRLTVIKKEISEMCPIEVLIWFIFRWQLMKLAKN